MQASLTSRPFKPSYPLTGSEYFLYRAENLKERGLAPNTYLEAYAGSLNLSENYSPVAITGTISFDATSTTVTGSGTDFLDELHIGQMIMASNGEPLVVKQLISATSFINARTPTQTGSGVTAKRLPVIFPLDVNRGVLLRGNAEHYDKGTIVAVGDGVLYVNGSVLSGDSLTATRSAQIAIYASATNNYDVQSLGFSAAPDTTNTAISVTGSGGTKNMSAGYYSFKLGYYSDITNGYSNSGSVLLSGGTAGYQVTAANSTFTFNFGSTSAPPGNATGYVIYATAFGGSSATSQLNAIQGPWYEVRRIPFTDLSGGVYTGTIAIDYVDAELGSTVASEDNAEPPDAEFVASLAGYLALISTDGKGVDSTGREDTTSPGPLISPQKSDNVDGYPFSVRVPTEKGEVILGVVSAAGRLFLMTPNTLQAVTPTGLPSSPFTLRPFWKRGFINPYNLAFVDDTLYGFSGNKAFRSIATGDQANEGYEFASDVESQMAEWAAGYVYVVHDPKNEEICFISSAIRQNDAGYWETDIYPYSLTKYTWQPKIVLSDPTRDMIVSGAATVNGRMEFLAGGRRAATTDRVDTFRYDEPSSTNVPYFVAWSYQDAGVETVAKRVSMLRPKGKFSSATMDVYAVTPDSVIDIEDLEDGSNPAVSIPLQNSTDVTQYEISKVGVKNALMFTCRLEGTSNYDGTGVPDQLHELAVTYSVCGQQR